MISFVNDYSEGAHPVILELMLKANSEQNSGYGKDIHSEKAKAYIKKHLEREDVDIHFIPGGTQTNLLVISAFLRPHQCVIAADSGHINVHETGAIEATGHKVITMPSSEGKLTVAAVEEALEYHEDEHMVQPKMVYISNSTELGTIYSKEELTALSNLCKAKGLLLFLDGARLGAALSSKSNDLTLSEIARLVDVFYIGGTKNGALLGEALVICKEELKEDFRFLMKQRGAMLAKGFVIGMQFEALFEPKEQSEGRALYEHCLYYELSKHANQMAEQIAGALEQCGYEFLVPPSSNQLFPILPNELLEKLSERFGFLIQKRINDKYSAIRLVTSWATREEAAEEFIAYLNSLS